MRGLAKLPANLVDLLANSTGRSVDHLYATLVYRLGLSAPFFREGWGDLGVVDFNEAESLLRGWPPEHFDTEVAWKRVDAGVRHGVEFELLEGTFRTPCYGRIYDALPEESRTARVQLLRPKQADAADCVVHLAGTGDHHFERRMQLGSPLLRKGIATMALESPYYGTRRPHWQEGSKLCRVSDLLTLGRATIEESLYLLTWAQREGFDRLGMCGFSMGGVHACMVASLYPHPVACVPLLAPRSAAVAFCDGALRDATAWQPLSAAADEAHIDVEETVMRAAQANLVTAAARRVLEACRRVGKGPQEGGASTSSDAGSSREALQRDMAELQRLSTAAAMAPPRQGGASGATLAEQAMSVLGKAEDLLRWSGGLRTLQLPRMFPLLPGATNSAVPSTATPNDPAMAFAAAHTCSAPGSSSSSPEALQEKGVQDGSAVEQPRSAAEAHASTVGRSWLRWELGREAAAQRDAARQRLAAVLETYTDVTRFPRPRRPDAAVIVGARNDAYVSAQSIRELAAHWPGAQVRWVPGGHVSAFVLQQPAFRAAIADSLARLSAPAAEDAEAA